MAISTPTQVIASGNVNNLGQYDTAVVTLTAGRLYLFQSTGYATGGSGLPTSITHDPLGTPRSFTLITGAEHAYESIRYHSVWYMIPAATTASALIRVVWPGTQSASGWRLVEITAGFDSTGGTTTFIQRVLASGTSTAIAATMSSFGATDNLTILFMAWGSGTTNPTQTIAPTESRTELGEHNDGERQSSGCHYQNPNGSDTTVGATLSASNTWGIIAIEVAATAAAATLSPPFERKDKRVVLLDPLFTE